MQNAISNATGQKNPKSDSRGPSFLSRLKDDASKDGKEALAEMVATLVFDPSQPIFIASGTTAFITAKRLLSSIPGTHIWTNSAPLLHAFIEMQDSGQLAPHVQMGVVKGEVNPTTGIISASPIGRLPTKTLLYSPHGLNRRGIVGRRDIREIKAVIAAHEEIVMPLTWDKLFRDAPSVIKHLGHAEKEIHAQIRKYRILLPAADSGAADTSGTTDEKIEFLSRLRNTGFEVDIGEGYAA